MRFRRRTGISVTHGHVSRPKTGLTLAPKRREGKKTKQQGSWHKKNTRMKPTKIHVTRPSIRPNRAKTSTIKVRSDVLHATNVPTTVATLKNFRVTKS